jgi:hypothetical protein
METGVHRNMRFMLHIGQYVAQMVNSVIVNEGHHTDNLSVPISNFFLN